MKPISSTHTFTNLTPYKIIVRDLNNQILEICPSGQVARVTTPLWGQVAVVNNIPIYSTQFGGVEGLPEPMEGTIYIVSSMVRMHRDVRHRQDVMSPGVLVRDQAGNPKYCLGLESNLPIEEETPKEEAEPNWVTLVRNAKSIAEFEYLRHRWMRGKKRGPKGWRKLLEAARMADLPVPEEFKAKVDLVDPPRH